ncbi:30880_t:CDS:2, partial [Racocetra persica]
ATEIFFLVNNSRNLYLCLYTIEFLGNIQGGLPIRYVNILVETIKYLIIQILQSEKPDNEENLELKEGKNKISMAKESENECDKEKSEEKESKEENNRNIELIEREDKELVDESDEVEVELIEGEDKEKLVEDESDKVEEEEESDEVDESNEMEEEMINKKGKLKESQN